MHDLNFI